MLVHDVLKLKLTVRHIDENEKCAAPKYLVCRENNRMFKLEKKKMSKINYYFTT